MTEYIIEWSGIGARIVELIGSVPACLIPKRLREERLREEIVRCRDCEHYREEYEECMRGLPSGNVVIFDCESHDFCSFGKRKKVDA